MGENETLNVVSLMPKDKSPINRIWFITEDERVFPAHPDGETTRAALTNILMYHKSFAFPVTEIPKDWPVTIDEFNQFLQYPRSKV